MVTGCGVSGGVVQWNLAELGAVPVVPPWVFVAPLERGELKSPGDEESAPPPWSLTETELYPREQPARRRREPSTVDGYSGAAALR